MTQLAAMNTPLYELMHRAGHVKLDTTMAYYMGDNEISKKKLLENINQLNTEEPLIELDTLTEDGNKQVIREADYVKMQKLTKEIPHISERIVIYGSKAC